MRSLLRPWRDVLRTKGERLAQEAGTHGPPGGVVNAADLFLLWRHERASPGRADAGQSIDSALWSALLGEAMDVGGLIAPADGPAPLRPQGGGGAIEVWTETELCAMHALRWLAIERGHDALRRRALNAAVWHVRETQPDNATNRPWAAHVFLEAWGATGDAGCRLYAETLLHNAEAGAEPTALIAEIVLDCAEALGRAIEG